jgi:hypothetical protein
MSPSRDHPLLGQRVTVTLDHDEPAEVTGILLWVDIDGEAAVEDDLGEVRCCWPCLAITPADDWGPPAWTVDTEAEDTWPGGSKPPRRVVTVYLPGDWPADQSPEGLP